jgi:Leucine-rich repeat (LRR) protein
MQTDFFCIFKFQFDACKNLEGLTPSETHQFNAYIYKKYPRLGEKIQKDYEFSLRDGIPMVIFSLSNLVSLNLSYHGIINVADEIGQLKNLRELLLDNCIRLESISGKIANLPNLTKISLINCLSLKTPPIEISR